MLIYMREMERFDKETQVSKIIDCDVKKEVRILKKKVAEIFILSVLAAAALTFAGCGSDEVISVSDLGKSSETTASEEADAGAGQDTMAGENSGAGDEAEKAADGTGSETAELTDTAELVGTWDEAAHTYTNSALGLELALTEDWTADTSTEGGTILSYDQGGITATAEMVFDIGGAYADTDAAWNAYYEYAGLDEDSLLLLASSAYAAYDTAAIGGKTFDTLTMFYGADDSGIYKSVAIGETEGCVAVLMLSIEAEIADFGSEEAAQNAMMEIVETVQVW